MQLGNFSVSLSVKDIRASLIFYEALGFKIWGGDINQNWLILKNGDCNIGLFQGMFENNILTFNPGWSNEGEELNPYADIREIQEELKKKNIQIMGEVDTNTKGPASFTITDPDGNTILFDQHR